MLLSASVSPPTTQFLTPIHSPQPAPILLPAKALTPVELPSKWITGNDGWPIEASGFCPSGMRMFDRNRLRRTDAVAAPLSDTLRLLLLSKLESSITTAPVEV